MSAPRPPETVESTLQEVIKSLGGAEYVGSVIGYSPSTVYAFSNADNRQNNLPAFAATLLDKEMKSENGTTPFNALALRKLEGVKAPTELCISTTALEAGRALGRYQATIKDAVCPKGPGGKELTPNERRALNENLDQFQKVLDECRAAVNSDGHKLGVVG